MADLNQGASIEAEREYLRWWTSIETDVRKSILVFAHREPERLHALVKMAFCAGSEAARRPPAAATGDGDLSPHGYVNFETLDYVVAFGNDKVLEGYYPITILTDEIRAAIEADRAQLAAKGQGEPVAQVDLENGNWMDVAMGEVPTWNRKKFKTRILYAAPASAQPADPFAGQRFLNWNRSQPKPPVQIGKELGIARKVLELAGAQPDQRESAAEAPDVQALNTSRFDVQKSPKVEHNAASPAAQPVAKDEQSALQGWQNAIESLSQQGQDSANNGADEQKGGAK